MHELRGVDLELHFQAFNFADFVCCYRGYFTEIPARAEVVATQEVVFDTTCFYADPMIRDDDQYGSLYSVRTPSGEPRNRLDILWDITPAYYLAPRGYSMGLPTRDDMRDDAIVLYVPVTFESTIPVFAGDPIFLRDGRAKLPGGDMLRAHLVKEFTAHTVRVLATHYWDIKERGHL